MQSAMVLRMVAAAVLAAVWMQDAEARATKWEWAKQLRKVGHGQLECDGRMQSAACCVCQSVVLTVEKELNETPDDHPIDVVFRISEEKKQIMYSHSQDRILDVLEGVCSRLPLRLPNSTPKKERLVAEACSGFVDQFEDRLETAFFNNFEPAKERVCTDLFAVCKPSSSTPAPSESEKEL